MRSGTESPTGNQAGEGGGGSFQEVSLSNIFPNFPLASVNSRFFQILKKGEKKGNVALNPREMGPKISSFSEGKSTVRAENIWVIFWSNANDWSTAHKNWAEDVLEIVPSP